MTKLPANRARTAPSLPAFKPVSRRYRKDGWTPERQRDFIAALADTGSVKQAAAQVGMAAENAYVLRRAPGAEGFAAAWQVALDHGIRRLEDIALERAIHGVEVPVYSYGKLVGTRRVYNDRLIMFLLRNRASDRFRPAAPAREMSEEEREALKRELMAEQMREGGDALAKVNAMMAEVRRRRALEEADPRGPITIRGDDREAFERWKREREGWALPAPQGDKDGGEEGPGVRQL